MNRPIVVPLDGSALAEQALPFAATIARATGSPVLLLSASFVAKVPGLDSADEQVSALTEAELYLHELKAHWKNRGIAVETCAPYAPAEQAIVREARARHAWLIAMATHGRAGLGRFLGGSVAEDVVREAAMPVLLMRAWHAGDSRARLRNGGPILIPLDGSGHAEVALAAARPLAAALHSGIVLAQAIPPRDTALLPIELAAPADPADRDTTESDTRAYLDRVAARLAYAGFAVEPIVRHGEPADVVATIAEECGAALTVLATHARAGLDQLVMGSVAKRIVRRGATPVLLVRPGQDELVPGTFAAAAIGGSDEGKG